MRGCTVLGDRQFALSSAEGDDVFLCRYCYNESRQASACCKIWHIRQDSRWLAPMLNNGVDLDLAACGRATHVHAGRAYQA